MTAIHRIQTQNVDKFLFCVLSRYRRWVIHNRLEMGFENPKYIKMDDKYDVPVSTPDFSFFPANIDGVTLFFSRILNYTPPPLNRSHPLPNPNTPILYLHTPLLTDFCTMYSTLYVQA